MRLLSIVIGILLFQTTLAQTPAFNYRRPLTGNDTAGWHRIVLPSDVFIHCSTDLRDLRVLSFSNGDTIENPYIIRTHENETVRESVTLPVMNESTKDGKLYVTFINSGKTINHLNLEFEEDNYFGAVEVEGSQNNKSWFSIVKDQKIFSVSNSYESFRSGDVYFPNSNYAYFRISVKSDKRLSFSRASFENYSQKNGKYAAIQNQWNVDNNKKSKQTVISIKFNNFEPVSLVSLEIASDNDYYRSAQIEMLRDSFKTEKGWIKNYEQVYNGYLSSIRPNEIDFQMVFTSELRITINNLDNAPLKIDRINIRRPEIELMVSVTGGETFLYYGDNHLEKPAYDIEHFQSKIPETASELTPGKEESLTKPIEHKTSIFENTAWLYAAMFVVIALLGFFTLRMMKGNPQGS